MVQLEASAKLLHSSLRILGMKDVVFFMPCASQLCPAVPEGCVGQGRCWAACRASVLFLWHFLLYFHHPSAYSSAQTTWVTGGPSKSGNPPSSDFDAFMNEAETKSWIWRFSLPSAPNPSVILIKKKPTLYPHPPLLYWKC